jgi:hypothetical protein
VKGPTKEGRAGRKKGVEEASKKIAQVLNAKALRSAGRNRGASVLTVDGGHREGPPFAFLAVGDAPSAKNEKQLYCRKRLKPLILHGNIVSTVYALSTRHAKQPRLA